MGGCIGVISSCASRWLMAAMCPVSMAVVSFPSARIHATVTIVLLCQALLSTVRLETRRKQNQLCL